MAGHEAYVSEAMYPNQQTGREFLVRFFVSGVPYKYRCGICKGPAVYRLEVYNHLQEPLNSEYYCEGDVPPIPEKIGD